MLVYNINMIQKMLQKIQKYFDNLTKENFLFIVFCFASFSIITCMVLGLAQSVWFDEAYSIELAKESLPEIIRLTSLDVHPPLYYILLHFWGDIFGCSEFSLRFMSAIFMGLALVIAGLFARKNFGNRAAIIALFLIALSPILIRYGFEIRMYSLASFIGIAATYILMAAIDENDIKKRRKLFAIYALLVVIGMFTLYYLALLWLAHFTWLIWRTVKSKKSIVRSEWFVAYLGSVLIFLPWLPYFVKQLNNGALAPISQAMTIENIIGVISFNFLYRPVWQLDPLLSLFVIFITAVLIILVKRSYELINKNKKEKMMLIIFYVAIPIIVLTIIGLFRPMYTERYLSHIAIGGLVCIGVAVDIVIKKLNRRDRVITLLMILCILIGLMQLSIVGNYNFQRLQKPNVDTIAAVVDYCDEDSVVLAADPYVAIELGYYIEDCGIYFYSTDEKLGGGYASLNGSDYQVSNPSEQLADREVIYFVYYGENEKPISSNFVLDERISGGAMTIEKYINKQD